MRFLADECTGPAVAQWLREVHHDVFSVFEQGRGIDDGDVISSWSQGLPFVFLGSRSSTSSSPQPDPMASDVVTFRPC